MEEVHTIDDSLQGNTRRSQNASHDDMQKPLLDGAAPPLTMGAIEQTHGHHIDAHGQGESQSSTENPLMSPVAMNEHMCPTDPPATTAYVEIPSATALSPEQLRQAKDNHQFDKAHTQRNGRVATSKEKANDNRLKAKQKPPSARPSQAPAVRLGGQASKANGSQRGAAQVGGSGQAPAQRSSSAMSRGSSNRRSLSNNTQEKQRPRSDSASSSTRRVLPAHTVRLPSPLMRTTSTPATQEASSVRGDGGALAATADQRRKASASTGDAKASRGGPGGLQANSSVSRAPRSASSRQGREGRPTMRATSSQGVRRTPSSLSSTALPKRTQSTSFADLERPRRTSSTALQRSGSSASVNAQSKRTGAMSASSITNRQALKPPALSVPAAAKDTSRRPSSAFSATRTTGPKSYSTVYARGGSSQSAVGASARQPPLKNGRAFKTAPQQGGASIHSHTGGHDDPPRRRSNSAKGPANSRAPVARSLSTSSLPKHTTTTSTTNPKPQNTTKAQRRVEPSVSTHPPTAARRPSGAVRPKIFSAAQAEPYQRTSLQLSEDGGDVACDANGVLPPYSPGTRGVGLERNATLIQEMASLSPYERAHLERLLRDMAAAQQALAEQRVHTQGGHPHRSSTLSQDKHKRLMHEVSAQPANPPRRRARPVLTAAYDDDTGAAAVWQEDPITAGVREESGKKHDERGKRRGQQDSRECEVISQPLFSDPDRTRSHLESPSPADGHRWGSHHRQGRYDDDDDDGGFGFTVYSAKRSASWSPDAGASEPLWIYLRGVSPQTSVSPGVDGASSSGRLRVPKASSASQNGPDERRRLDFSESPAPEEESERAAGRNANGSAASAHSPGGATSPRLPHDRVASVGVLLDSPDPLARRHPRARSSPLTNEASPSPIQPDGPQRRKAPAWQGPLANGNREVISVGATLSDDEDLLRWDDSVSQHRSQLSDALDKDESDEDAEGERLVRQQQQQHQSPLERLRKIREAANAKAQAQREKQVERRRSMDPSRSAARESDRKEMERELDVTPLRQHQQTQQQTPVTSYGVGIGGADGSPLAPPAHPRETAGDTVALPQVVDVSVGLPRAPPSSDEDKAVESRTSTTQDQDREDGQVEGNAADAAESNPQPSHEEDNHQAPSPDPAIPAPRSTASTPSDVALSPPPKISRLLDGPESPSVLSPTAAAGKKYSPAQQHSQRKQQPLHQSQKKREKQKASPKRVPVANGLSSHKKTHKPSKRTQQRHAETGLTPPAATSAGEAFGQPCVNITAEEFQQLLQVVRCHD